MYKEQTKLYKKMLNMFQLEFGAMIPVFSSGQNAFDSAATLIGVVFIIREIVRQQKMGFEIRIIFVF